MNERDQIISYLLQQSDLKNRTIEEFQKQLAELQKQLSELKQTSVVASS